MENKKEIKKDAVPKKNKFLLIFIAAFVSAVLVLGLALGIVSAVKKSKTVVSLNGVGMDCEVASFFASLSKASFKQRLEASGVKNVEDSPGFWNRDSGNGSTYRELLEKSTEEYISQVLVTNYLYDRYARLSSQDKDIISRAVEETLDYKAGGDVDEFNKEASAYGFSYSSYKDAVTMMYKALMAQRLICGEDGENLEGETDIIRKYLDEYTHVKLLFIRTETTYVLDDKGNRVVENDGKYAIRDLTEAEKLERQALISDIREYISRGGTGNYEMSPEMFDYYLEHNDEGDAKSHGYGYYFHKNADFSQAFKEAYADVVDTAYEMKAGSFGEAEVDFGICFIYKYAVNYSDLENDALGDCFSDFYSNLSDVFFSEQVSEFTKDVKFSENFYDIDMIVLPYNYIYVPSFG